MTQWIATRKEYEEAGCKDAVLLFSMEFLMGRALGNNIINYAVQDEVSGGSRMSLASILNVIEDQEPDAALGNGGLGRLAACFLDSLQHSDISAYGCGIRYHYGMFKQKIENGYQVEVPDDWLEETVIPLKSRRPEYATEVKFGGYVRTVDARTAENHFVQEGYQSVHGCSV
ncbi:MAG: glycogen/starch/alpha-glucan phosphorylase [Clostridium sp.]